MASKDSPQRFLHNASWTADVHADKTFTALAVHGTVAQQESGFVGKEIHQSLLRQSHSTAIEPNQERGLGRDSLDAKTMRGEEIDDLPDVALKVFTE